MQAQVRAVWSPSTDVAVAIATAGAGLQVQEEAITPHVISCFRGMRGDRGVYSGRAHLGPWEQQAWHERHHPRFWGPLMAQPADLQSSIRKVQVQYGNKPPA